MKVKRILNLTPHPVSILDAKGKVIRTFPPSGQVARLVEKEEPLAPLSIEGVEIPLYRKDFGKVENLPNAEEGTLYIVSLPVAQALPERTDLLIPHQLVRDNEGRVVGARALATLSKKEEGVSSPSSPTFLEGERQNPSDSIERIVKVLALAHKIRAIRDKASDVLMMTELNKLRSELRVLEKKGLSDEEYKKVKEAVFGLLGYYF